MSFENIVYHIIFIIIIIACDKFLIFRMIKQSWCGLLEEMVRRTGSFLEQEGKIWCGLWEDP